MRNASIEQYDTTPRAVVAMGTDYPDGYLLPRHRHRRAQLLYGASGGMQVRTGHAGEPLHGAPGDLSAPAWKALGGWPRTRRNMV
ncbi:MAG: hypothetical protein E7C76_20680, partial [Pseudomonas aeruginosa]|nr:hypothetical protein [Pseudomonas aeruginosa]